MKKTKQLLTLFLSVSMTFSLLALTKISSFAEEVSILDYLTYEIADGEVAITACDTSISGDIVIPDTIEGYPVTEISTEAFRNCDSITNVIISENMRFIGNAAFRNCDILASVTIPASVTGIAYYAFRDCYKLENITVDENNQYYSSDEYGALFNKEKTKIIQYPTGNSRTEYSIPDGVTSIEPSAFETCSNLTSVTIPDSVTLIDSYAFSKCRNIISITIPDSVKTIGYGSFYWCRSLVNVTIPPSVTYIGALAFGGCTALTDIMILTSDCTIDDSAAAIYSAATIYSYAGSTAEAYAEKYSRNFVILDEDGNISVLNYITYEIVDDEAVITDCEETVSGYITVPAEIKGYPVTAIGENAFASCISLTGIIIPDTVTAIEADTFSGCSSLKKVIATNVDSVGEGAFSGCTALDMFITFADALTVADTAFDASENLTIFTKDTAQTNAPYTLDFIVFYFDDNTLSFIGEYKSDLYYLFDLVAVMCTYYDDVQYLFFESFEAVSADEGHIYYYTDSGARAQFDGTAIGNVTFSVEAFNSDGEIGQLSFNELCDESLTDELKNFYLIVESAEELSRGNIEINVSGSDNNFLVRILKAIVNLFNKLFAFFRR